MFKKSTKSISEDLIIRGEVKKKTDNRKTRVNLEIWLGFRTFKLLKYITRGRGGEREEGDMRGGPVQEMAG